MSDKRINWFLRQYFPVVDCIADLFGRNCEVVLHKVVNLRHSIIKIRNGHITGRKVGDSITDVGLKMIREAENGLTILGNYNPKTTTGKILKSNAINIRDLRGKLIGMLCINLDVSKLMGLDHEIQNFCLVEKAKVSGELYDESIWSMIQKVLDTTIAKNDIPIHNFTKKDKLKVIRNLDEKGLFLVKGAVLQLSKSLGISPPTIYKYLEEIRFKSKEKEIFRKEII